MLLAAGVAQVFHPGGALEDIAQFIRDITPRAPRAARRRPGRRPRMNKPLDQTLPRTRRRRRPLAAGIRRADRHRQATCATAPASPIKPLYTPRDWNGDGYDADVGFPGQPPYTRGIYPTMHRGRTWTQRQLIGLGTPADYNARLSATSSRRARPRCR